MTLLYLEPRSLEEGVAALAEHGDAARVVAGGTDLLVVARKRRSALADVLISLHRIDEINGIEPDDMKGAAIAYGGPEPIGGLRIGAATPHALVERHPAIVERFTALADGSALVGSPATRHVGTIGGNLANASPANDAGSALLVFDVSVELWSERGVRTVPLADYFVGPGRTAAKPDELLAFVVLPGHRPDAPDAPGGGAAGTNGAAGSSVGSSYIRLDYRQAMEIAVVGAAAMVKLTDDSSPSKATVEEARLALTAVAPTCIEVQGIGALLRGRDPDDPTAWGDAGRRAAEAASPIDDVRAPAGYRAAMIPVIVKRAFDVAVRRARGELVPVPATLAVGAR